MEVAAVSVQGGDGLAKEAGQSPSLTVFHILLEVSTADLRLSYLRLRT